MDPATLQQINDILGNTNSGSSSNGGLFDINAILQPLMPFIYLLTAVSTLIAILYLMNAITAWRSQRAILEMRKILREMNERDKVRHSSVDTPVSSATSPATQATGTPTTDASGDPVI